MVVQRPFRQVPSVVSTKLQPPRLPPDFVVRPRLHARLDAGIDAKLTLVCAPAGFGKTTLLAGWLQGDSRPLAWVSLDEHDGGLTAFLQILVEGLQLISPRTGRAMLSMLTQADPPPLGYLGVMLADELAQIEEQVVVVLDDYHLVHDQSVHVLLSTLLRRLPENVQLIIVSRVEPPLPSATLRARRELAEIHTNDLRFDHDEVRELLERSSDRALSRADVDALHARSEGWAAMLRLATLPGAETAAFRDTAADPASGIWWSIDGYLLDEVLDRQSPELRRFLLQTSVLDTLCAPLCDALVNDVASGDGRRLLAEIERSNLFLIALDPERHWYRYHHLFRDMLRRRLEGELDGATIRALHARASAWLADAGQYGDAIHHALAAGDDDGAARLADQGVSIWLGRHQWPLIDTWLRRLPDRIVDPSPALTLARCYLFQARGQRGDFVAQLTHLDALLADAAAPIDPAFRTTFQGEADVLWAIVQLQRGADQEARERAARALEALPLSSSPALHRATVARGRAAVVYALAEQCVGDGDAVLEWLRQQLASAGEAQPTYLGGVLLAQAFVEQGSGRLPRLVHTGRQVLALTGEHGLATISSWAHLLLGRLAYEWNELETAQAHFEASLAARDRAHASCTLNAIMGAALVSLSSGRPDEARRLILDELEIAERSHRARAIERLRSFEARLALASGDYEAALAWIDSISPTPSPTLSFDVEEPRLTRVRIFLAADTAAGLCEASAVIGEAVALAEARHSVPRLVEALALCALVEQARGDLDAALTTLARALEIAEPGRFTRTFVDLGPPMAGLLAQLVHRVQSGPLDPIRGSAERLMRACRDEAAGAAATAVPSRILAPAEDVEPLTWREREILHLLDARYSNKEIAETLCISWETVKKHAANIYGKLQVTGRRDAVARAHQLGLLRDIPVPTV